MDTGECEDLTCECCGSTENVEWTYDPWLREMFDEEEEHLLCAECFRTKQDDI